ncbi:MAG: LCP family protein, partial [Anaerolineaceae bacterium]|nr:LCP family protein [Anaerolineaceae bacterium]
MTIKRNTPNYDPNQATQPFQPVTASATPTPIQSKQATRKRTSCLGCFGCLAPILIVLAVLAVYLLAPMRTNLLLLGADRTEGQETYGRADTIILMTLLPTQPYVGMLSIPRDLWVPIPGHGENRINTAHFFAELDQPGSGPAATAQVIRNEFHVTAPYFVRIRFSGFKDVVTAMGGVDVDLPKAMANLPPGRHHLDGDQALAFVRERKSTDDFFRMEHGQMLIKAAFQQMLNPAEWARAPQISTALSNAVQTNLPVWEWPRLGLALLRVGPQGIDSRTINREMVNPFITSGGADVLAPNWE